MRITLLSASFCIFCGLFLSGCSSIPPSMRGGQPVAIVATVDGPAVQVSPLSNGWVADHPWLTTFTAAGAGFGGYHLCRKQNWLGLGDHGNVNASGNSDTRSSSVNISGNNDSTIIVNQTSPSSMNETKP
jgi:hypothetical protein